MRAVLQVALIVLSLAWSSAHIEAGRSRRSQQFFTSPATLAGLPTTTANAASAPELPSAASNIFSNAQLTMPNLGSSLITPTASAPASSLFSGFPAMSTSAPTAASSIPAASSSVMPSIAIGEPNPSQPGGLNLGSLFNMPSTSASSSLPAVSMPSSSMTLPVSSATVPSISFPTGVNTPSTASALPTSTLTQPSFTSSSAPSIGSITLPTSLTTPAANSIPTSSSSASTSLPAFSMPSSVSLPSSNVALPTSASTIGSLPSSASLPSSLPSTSSLPASVPSVQLPTGLTQQTLPTMPLTSPFSSTTATRPTLPTFTNPMSSIPLSVPSTNSLPSSNAPATMPSTAAIPSPTSGTACLVFDAHGQPACAPGTSVAFAAPWAAATYGLQH